MFNRSRFNNTLFNTFGSWLYPDILSKSPSGSSASPGISYDSLTPQFQWTADESEYTQTDYQIRLYSEPGSLLYDSGEIQSGGKSHDLPNTYKLTYSTVYQWELRIRNEYNIWTDYSTRDFFQVKVGSPQNVTAAADNFGAKITINWDDSAADNLQGYDVYRSTSLSGVYSKINDSLLTSSMYEDFNVITDQAYYYKVQAFVSDSEISAFSDIVTATAVFTAWFINEFKFEGPTRFNDKIERNQNKRKVLGKQKKVVQDRGFSGSELELEIYLTDDQYTTGQEKYTGLMDELKKTTPLSIRDPFARSWKVSPGDFEARQLPTGKLEYVVTFPLTEVN